MPARVGYPHPVKLGKPTIQVSNVPFPPVLG